MTTPTPAHCSQLSIFRDSWMYPAEKGHQPGTPSRHWPLVSLPDARRNLGFSSGASPFLPAQDRKLKQDFVCSISERQKESFPSPSTLPQSLEGAQSLTASSLLLQVSVAPFRHPTGPSLALPRSGCSCLIRHHGGLILNPLVSSRREGQMLAEGKRGNQKLTELRDFPCALDKY